MLKLLNAPPVWFPVILLIAGASFGGGLLLAYRVGRALGWVL